MPKKPMKYGTGLKDGAKIPQHKALAMGVKPAQGAAQSVKRPEPKSKRVYK